MPFPEEYDAAAVVLDEAAAAARVILEPARALMGQGVMVGGQLTTIVTTELETARTALDEAGEELTALAEFCRTRAADGRNFQAAQADFVAADGRFQAEQRSYGMALTDRELGIGPDPGPPPEPPGPPPEAPYSFR